MKYPIASFFRDGETVRLNLRIPMRDYDSQGYIFSLNLGNQSHASLLTEKLCETLSGQLEEIKRSAYEAGWKDAKAKRRKRQDFYGDFDSDPETM